MTGAAASISPSTGLLGPECAGKRFVVFGLARSGVATVEALLAAGAEVMAWDRQESARNDMASRAAGPNLHFADPLAMDLSGFDAVVVSPGVPINHHPIAAKARDAKVPLIGDIELFARARAHLPPHRVVGITGTNGKSTATALLHHLLQQAGVPSMMGGNIGLPILAQPALAPAPQGTGVYVLELSSYQLDLTRSLTCEAAALTNISPDHLDRYESFADYAASKAHLFAMQSDAQFAVLGCADEKTRAIQQAEASRRASGRAICADAKEWAAHQASWPSLQGPHNLQNVAIAGALAIELGLTKEEVLAGFASFTGLPHRMERVGEYGGVLFINDSKATNPASAAPALSAFLPNPEPRIHWICGGLPKGDNLDECAPAFGNIAAAYTIGEAGPLFADILSPFMKVERCEMLCEALRRAIAAARPGDVVMLSPACASFDQFRDYETRGDAFRKIVACLAGEGLDECPHDRKGAS